MKYHCLLIIRKFLFGERWQVILIHITYIHTSLLARILLSDEKALEAWSLSEKDLVRGLLRLPTPTTFGTLRLAVGEVGVPIDKNWFLAASLSVNGSLREIRPAGRVSDFLASCCWVVVVVVVVVAPAAAVAVESRPILKESLREKLT